MNLPVFLIFGFIILINFAENGNATNTDLQLVYAKSRFAAILNISGNVAEMMDYQSTTGGFFNGNTGVVIVVDLKTSIAYKIRNSKTVWLSSKETFMTYIKRLESMRDLIDCEDGVDIANVDADSLKEMSEVNGNIGGKSPFTVNDLFERVEQTKTLAQLLNGPMKGLFNGNIAISVQSSIDLTIEILLAIGDELKIIPGGLQALLKNDVKLDLYKIFNTGNLKDSLDIFVKQIRAIGKHWINL